MASRCRWGESRSVQLRPPTRIKNSIHPIKDVLSSKRLTAASASSLAGKLQFLAGSLYSRVGYPGIAPLFRRQSESAQDLTPEIVAGLLWLLEVLDNVGPREWSWGSCTDMPWTIFGDASEPGHAAGPRVIGAILQSPGGERRFYFSAQVPNSLLQAFNRRSKQISILELLWAVVALILWQAWVARTFVLLFEDNTSAEHGLVRGMSKPRDINRLLSLFWGTAACARAHIWTERVTSLDNPADCLTKPGLNHAHLGGACDLSTKVDWAGLFEALEGLLAPSHPPRWGDIADL